MASGKYIALAALYLSQGLPYGFFTLALPIVLRQRGVDLATISASSLLLLPWALKFVWGPLIDRFGSRRAWIVPLQLCTALTLVLLAAAQQLDTDAELRALGVGMLLAALLASIQDVATDGLAVQLLTGEDRGLGNGIQVGAYRLGMIIGGSAVLVVYTRLGGSAAFLTLAALLLLATIPAALLNEPARPRTRVSPLEVLRALPLLGASWWLLLALFKAGDAMASPMLKTMLVDAGMSPESLAGLLGLGGSAAGLFGALLGGRLVDRIGIVRAMLVSTALQALALACNLWPAALGVTPVSAWSVVLVEHIFSGMATATLFAAMMSRCRAGLEASDFTLQACVVVLASGVFGALGGSIAESYGYVVHFSASALLAAAGVALVAAVVRAR